jgi:hypothetical protein
VGRSKATGEARPGARVRLLIAAALVAATAATAACSGRGKAARGAVGGGIAAAVTAGLATAARVRAPWRCAALDWLPPPGPTSVQAGGRSWSLDGRIARRAPTTPGARVVRIAFVADAEAPTPVTLGVLRALRDRLAKLKVDAIVSLGGMGGTTDELEGVLGALADGSVPVFAIPGDREPAAGHRAAVAALASRGVVDGSVVRWVVVDKVGIATLPGQPFVTRLAAGVEGCGHADGDAAAVLATRPDGVEVAILASQRAPRHADGDDQGALGAAAGDLGLATAIATPDGGTASPIALVVHAALDGAPTPAGTLAAGGRPRALATGVTSASPRLDGAGRRVTPAALVVTVEGNRVAWQPIPL